MTDKFNVKTIYRLTKETNMKLYCSQVSTHGIP